MWQSGFLLLLFLHLRETKYKVFKKRLLKRNTVLKDHMYFCIKKTPNFWVLWYMLVISVLEKLRPGDCHSERPAWVSDLCLKISFCSLLALEVSRTSEYCVSAFHQVLSVCSLFLMSSWWTQGQLCHMPRWIRGLSRPISSSRRTWINVISSVEFLTSISLPPALHLLYRQVCGLDHCHFQPRSYSLWSQKS